ncbi:hypothetical protein TRFO_07840 [Tritrichomonas foetus]|uniref:Ubiquitin-like domain-containing protein n=1 Tax=Tritrichomonas foetus TaxID=1144522 RepID=A0A1J4JN26_9EUKA|nr:hypothetical protein TRFO_07840 [Tritrichomonas foetus]|eukprot:OHT00529.1 hypothetical protein TRFO_07840 [Tritrichomonas foetus]
MIMNDCLEASTKTITEITIEMAPYDDLTEEPHLRFTVDEDSPICSFIDFLNEKFTIPPNIVRLSFNGNELDPDTTFAENGIKENDRLTIDFEANDFHPASANATLLEAANILSQVQIQAAIVQMALNGDDMEDASQKVKEFIELCEKIAPELSEKADVLPKRY